MAAYYNEIDKDAAAWLRQLIKNGLIAPGDVDERDIRDVTPQELRPYTQCHFFAGIGVWSYALRLAGWPDDRPVWTGSCPCQPFSAAGRRKGAADERHLWPHWFHLISERHPPAIFGEQVASKDGLAWIDLVLSDLEGKDYAATAVDLCAAGIGAPHIRQRLWLVANSCRISGGLSNVRGKENPEARRSGQAGGMAHGAGFGLHGGRPSEKVLPRRQEQEPERLCDAGGLGHSGEHRAGEHAGELSSHEKEHGIGPKNRDNAPEHPGPVNGYWGDAEWLPCIDGKARPVESGTFPLAHGAPARVVRLRGYGNAIVAPLAAEVIATTMEFLCGEN